MSISLVSSKTVTIASNDSARAFVQTPSSSANFIARSSTDGANADETSIVTQQSPSSEHVAQAVRQVNEAFSQKGQSLYALIEKDESTGIPVVKVMDKSTDEIISQFPSKEIIAIAESIKQYQEDKGYLVDVNA